MGVKCKFFKIWKSYSVDNQRVSKEVTSFPGKARLRWAIVNPRRVVCYEGKPSVQALKQIFNLANKSGQAYRLIEFDKIGPFMITLVTPRGNFQLEDINWGVWLGYHGDVLPESLYKKLMNTRIW
jgi:hypothetical protein